MIIKGNVSKKLLSAIDNFADVLFSPQLKRHIEIKIVYRKNLAHYGLADIDDYNKSGLPRYFIIEIKKELDENERIRTVAHEMVHVRQYALLQLNAEMNMWHGKKVNADKIPYMDQPWEIEAHDVGDFLYEEYINGNV
jgi:hypothetical protein